MKVEWNFWAHVVKVVDGDTLKLDVDTGFRHWILAENYRLARIDAPEPKTVTKEAGDAATKFVQDLFVQHGSKLLITSSKHGKYRWVIEAYLGQPNFTLNLSDELVRAGHAVYKDF